MNFRKNLLVAAMVIAATAVALLVGCKKEKDEAVSKTDRSEAQALLERIREFQELRNAVNSGAKTDGSMTLEEMRQALDLVSNYEYSQHMTDCNDIVLDTLHITMPMVDGEGNVSEADVVATYNAFETALEKRMFGVNDDRTVPSFFSIVMPNVGAKDDSDIDVVFDRGIPSNDSLVPYPGPFVEGDDYVWGLGLGLCDPPMGINLATDAANELSKKFVFTPDEQHQGQSYIVYNVEHGLYAPCETSLLPDYVYYVDPNMEDCAPTWLFYVEGLFDEEPCIDYNEMNCYWRSIRRNITLPNAPLHYGPLYNSPYHQCNIEDWIFYRRMKRVHLADVVYCYVSWAEPELPPFD